MNRRTLLGSALAGVLVGAGGLATWRAFEADLARARARVAAAGSQIADSRHGPVEYAIAGAGTRVLMIHGAGGGFDQGLAIAEPLVARGRQVVAPSRFGYLRSAFPSDPSPENQADAFVDLLDVLEIDRLPVIGVSAGALSAQALAIRHPERCAALV
jgi:pimeloyl-ACP methyl ester carboxylesterase